MIALERAETRGDVTDPPGELRASHQHEAGDDQDDADDQPGPRVVVEVRPEDSVLEILRERSVVAEGPERVDQAHEPGEPEDRTREEEPAGPRLFAAEHVDVGTSRHP